MHSDSSDENQNAALDENEAPVDEAADTVVMPEAPLTDNVGDVSVEINVEELVAQIEAEQDNDTPRKKEVRQRLEEIAEEQGFEDTYAIEFEQD